MSTFYENESSMLTLHRELLDTSTTTTTTDYEKDDDINPFNENNSIPESRNLLLGVDYLRDIIYQCTIQ